MKRLLQTIILLASVALLSCSHTPTRTELIECTATDYLKSHVHDMTDYTIVGSNTQSDDSIFVGFVSYRCTIADLYSIYKLVFVSMDGDRVVYVGTDEYVAECILNE